MCSPEPLTKVHVCLPNDGIVIGEHMWATPLGRDLYELRSIPFRAYGLNYGDVVRATVDRPREPPEIRFVVRSSGHRTIRVFLAGPVGEAATAALLAELKSLHVGYEGGWRRFYALDLPLESDIGAVCARLEIARAGGLLEYETCEAWRAGSFDLPRRVGRARAPRS